MSSSARKDCFVVMPFGQKKWIDLVAAAEPEGLRPSEVIETNAAIRYARVDFDRIYKEIIKPAVEGESGETPVAKGSYGLKARRSDEVKESGMIHREMIRSIIEADVVVVDITLNNPNVFYELGVRHSLRRSTTVVVRHAAIQAQFPFNISGMRAVEYDDRSPEAIKLSKQRLRDAIQASFEGKDVDSLVHTLFNDILITRNAPPILEQEIVEREVKEAPGRFVGFVTGDIQRVRNCDAWVNPENTKMEMGRLHDDSISAVIRFYGSKRNHLNYVENDTIREDLLCQVDLHESVEPGTVLSTGPGELARSNNLKVVLHIAALHGEPGKGYLPIRDYPGCIMRVLEEVEALNAGKSVRSWRRRI